MGLLQRFIRVLLIIFNREDSLTRAFSKFNDQNHNFINLNIHNTIITDPNIISHFIFKRAYLNHY